MCGIDKKLKKLDYTENKSNTIANAHLNNKKLPKPKREYVALVDVTGMQNRIDKSVSECVTYIF